MVVATKIAVNLKKLIFQHASMEKKMQIVLGSVVLIVAEINMVLSARSTRKTHHIRVKQHEFQRNNILVNF